MHVFGIDMETEMEPGAGKRKASTSRGMQKRQRSSLSKDCHQEDKMAPLHEEVKDPAEVTGTLGGGKSAEDRENLNPEAKSKIVMPRKNGAVGANKKRVSIAL
jgi:hypothetical protein